jgi:transcriptional regulator with XRE-family HTH domain
MNSRGTLRAQWLGKLLRDLREQAGCTLKDAGDHIMRDPSTISRMESGALPARVPDVMELLNLYGVNDEILRTGLERLSRDVWRTDWWDGYAPHVAGGVIDAAWLEARTEDIRDFGALVLPGLLQTPGYAEAVMRTADPDVPSDQVQQWVEFRMRRRDVLTRADAPHYTAVLDESCLQRAAGGPTIMREQLAYLLELSHRPNVTVRILPFSTGPLPSSEGAFTIYTLPSPFPVIVQMNSEGGALYLEMPKAQRFAEAYTRLETQAFDDEESRAWLKTRMEQVA